MKIQFSTQLKELRKNRQMSQERLAELLGITPQAVSKYECAQSYPDIELLPRLAEVFDVSIDVLLLGEKGVFAKKAPESSSTETISAVAKELSPDHVLRIVQCLGNRVLRQDEYDPEKKIPMIVPEEADGTWNGSVEVWGSIEITGDIGGSVSAGASITCRNIAGSASAGASLTCRNVSGGVEAGSSANISGEVAGTVTAGTNVTCGNVSGDVCAGMSVTCEDVEGNVNAGTSVTGKYINGSISLGV